MSGKSQPINIPGIGRSISKILSEEFGLAGLIELCHKANCVNVLCNVDSIDEKRAHDIKNGVLNNGEYIANLRNLLTLKGSDVAESEPLPTICLTGKFPEKKSYYYEKLKGKYAIMDVVMKDFNILVVADPSKQSSKQQKAGKQERWELALCPLII